MDENNQYVVPEQTNNEQKKKKVNVILWIVVVMVITVIISFALQGYSSSLASEGEAGMPLATFIESIARILPFILLPIGIGAVALITSIKNKK